MVSRNEGQEAVDVRRLGQLGRRLPQKGPGPGQESRLGLATSLPGLGNDGKDGNFVGLGINFFEVNNCITSGVLGRDLIKFS